MHRHSPTLAPQHRHLHCHISKPQALSLPLFKWHNNVGNVKFILTCQSNNSCVNKIDLSTLWMSVFVHMCVYSNLCVHMCDVLCLCQYYQGLVSWWNDFIYQKTWLGNGKSHLYFNEQRLWFMSKSCNH